MNISISSFFRPVSACKHEIEIMYFGRTSEFLMMTSERMGIANETDTLKQVLNRLRERGGRWAYELDDRHVICTVNGKTAALSDTIAVGEEMGIFSRKSWDEI
jgi:molybdopterin converting factor small subunit